MKNTLKIILVLLSFSMLTSTIHAKKTKVLDLNKDTLELSGDGNIDTFKLDGVTITTDIKKNDNGYYTTYKRMHHGLLKLEFNESSTGYSLLMKGVKLGKIGCMELNYKMTDDYGETIYFIRDPNSNLQIGHETIYLRNHSNDLKWNIKEKVLEFFVNGKKVSTTKFKNIDGIKTIDIPMCAHYQDTFNNLMIVKTD